MPTDEVSDSQIENTFPLILEKSIDNIIKNEGYLKFNVSKRPITSEGANFLGELFEVDVDGTTKDGSKKLSLFLKKSLTGENLQNLFSVSELYNREIYFYQELSKIYKELQDDANVPLKERYNVIKSYDTQILEAIVLENMNKKGYSVPNRMDVASLKYAELCMQQLAKFHGLSFVLEKKRPKYFDSNIRDMKSPIVWNDNWKSTVNNLTNISKNCLDDDSEKTIIEAFLPKLLDVLPKYFCDEDVTETIGCLCHGDYRLSNILSKSTDGIVTDVIPVDYQLMHYGCPAQDIIFFLYLGTDWEFRKQHMENLKNLYYSTLRRYLQYFDLDVDIIYPRNEFERIFKERLEYGLMISIYGYSIIFVPENNAPHLGNDELAAVEFEPNKKLVERLQGLLHEFIERGYFNDTKLL